MNAGLNPFLVETPRGGIHGSLHVPPGGGPFPAVLLCHGFTGTRIETHCLFVKMSRLLEKIGIASCRFDFIGSGESDGDFVDMTVQGEVEDTLAVLDYVKALDLVDSSRLGTIGLSLGGAVAALAAGESRSFRAVCLWAPVAFPGELFLDPMGTAALNSLNRRGWIDQAGNKLGLSFFEKLGALRPVEALASAEMPVLILHGSQDTIVPLEHARAYQGACKDARLVIVNQSDHTFNSVAWEKKVLGKTLEWFGERLKP